MDPEESQPKKPLCLRLISLYEANEKEEDKRIIQHITNHCSQCPSFQKENLQLPHSQCEDKLCAYIYWFYRHYWLNHNNLPSEQCSTCVNCSRFCHWMTLHSADCLTSEYLCSLSLCHGSLLKEVHFPSNLDKPDQIVQGGEEYLSHPLPPQSDREECIQDSSNLLIARDIQIEPQQQHYRKKLSDEQQVVHSSPRPTLAITPVGSIPKPMPPNQYYHPISRLSHSLDQDECIKDSSYALVAKGPPINPQQHYQYAFSAEQQTLHSSPTSTLTYSGCQYVPFSGMPRLSSRGHPSVHVGTSSQQVQYFDPSNRLPIFHEKSMRQMPTKRSYHNVMYQPHNYSYTGFIHHPGSGRHFQQYGYAVRDPVKVQTHHHFQEEHGHPYQRLPYVVDHRKPLLYDQCDAMSAKPGHAISGLRDIGDEVKLNGGIKATEPTVSISMQMSALQLAIPTDEDFNSSWHGKTTSNGYGMRSRTCSSRTPSFPDYSNQDQSKSDLYLKSTFQFQKKPQRRNSTPVCFDNGSKQPKTLPQRRNSDPVCKQAKTQLRWQSQSLTDLPLIVSTSSDRLTQPSYVHSESTSASFVTKRPLLRRDKNDCDIPKIVVSRERSNNLTQKEYNSYFKFQNKRGNKSHQKTRKTEIKLGELSRRTTSSSGIQSDSDAESCTSDISSRSPPTSGEFSELDQNLSDKDEDKQANEKKATVAELIGQEMTTEKRVQMIQQMKAAKLQKTGPIRYNLVKIPDSPLSLHPNVQDSLPLMSDQLSRVDKVYENESKKMASTNTEAQLIQEMKTFTLSNYVEEKDKGAPRSPFESKDDVKQGDENLPASKGFMEAKNTSLVPFLHHHIMVCNSKAQCYTIDGHDITIRIPEGAVAEGETLHFEIGVAMYGPFRLPEKSQPISPFVWVCILEKDVELKKPFQLIVPHFLTQLTEERIVYHNVRFAKANHDNLSSENKSDYSFHDCDTKPLFTSVGYRSYGVLITKHFCFYCLKANQTAELAVDAGYSLVRIETPLSLDRNEVNFSAIYLLDTCLRSLEEQFPCDEGHTISRCYEFKFKCSDTEPCIKLSVPQNYQHCEIAMDPLAAEIRASEIDFWGKEFDVMHLRHRLKMYPPRVKMTVMMKSLDLNFKLLIKFIGCSNEGRLDTELTFPLGLNSLSRSTSSVSSNTEPVSHKLKCGKPELADVFRQLFFLSADWKNIGSLLKVPIGILDQLEADEPNVHSRLRAMLTEWLKQVNPSPTWAQLIDTVELFDQCKAEELKVYCKDIIL